MPGAPTGAFDEGGGSEGLPDWALWVLITLGGSIVAIIVFVLIDQAKKGPKKKLTVNNDQIGSYRIVGLMWTGATSQVFEVSEFGSGRHMAIKILLPEYAHDADERALMFHEAEVAQSLAHSNIVKIQAIVRDKDHPHVVMEFFPGGNLKARIQHKEIDYIKQHAHGILKQIATALAFMNMKGWVHRDIKPENILVDANGEARLIDFAIAQPIKSGMAKKLHSKQGQAQGTHSYMSPEQIRNEPLDGRADIYSFGATAYEVVTGRPPFRAASRADLLQKHLSEKPESPCVHNPAVHPDFANLVLKMLEKDPDKRPASFHKVLEQMKAIRVFKVEVQGKEKTGGMQGR